MNHRLPSSLEYSDAPSIPMASTLLEHILKPLHFTYSSCTTGARYSNQTEVAVRSGCLHRQWQELSAWQCAKFNAKIYMSYLILTDRIIMYFKRNMTRCEMYSFMGHPYLWLSTKKTNVTAVWQFFRGNLQLGRVTVSYTKNTKSCCSRKMLLKLN